jgi:hypothetical protein
MLLFLLACKQDDGLVVWVPPAELPVYEAFLADVPGLVAKESDDPAGEKDGVAIVLDHDTPEGYRLEGAEPKWVVHGGDRLGAQYGLAALLEAWGARFSHPYDTRVPATFDFAAAVDGEEVAPDVPRRGIHLHTLHPIEGYYDFWENDQARAEKVID